MDTSETYIKMCEKAEEIQKLNPNLPENKVYEQGNWYTHHGDEPFVEDYDYIVAGATWLPRQDQLQEMVVCQGTQLFIVFMDKRWHSFPINSPWNPVLSYDSLEELWLSFVMKQNYHKIWDGGEWKTS